MAGEKATIIKGPTGPAVKTTLKDGAAKGDFVKVRDVVGFVDHDVQANGEAHIIWACEIVEIDRLRTNNNASLDAKAGDALSFNETHKRLAKSDDDRRAPGVVALVLEDSDAPNRVRISLKPH